MDTIGRYQILEKLGQGGMGVVHRAYDTLLQRVVAVKLISAPIHDNTDLRERFFREARAAGQLTHKNIITIHDLGEHDGRPYLAMEFLEGADLQRRLADGEPMTLARKLDLCIELCEALDFAHAHGVVHRDVKPANIFITTTGSVKILDFGLARLVTSELTNSNMMMGTLNYMAPEQVRGERADHRSDVFSVGVVMYELFSGRKAFQGDSFASTLFKILEGAPRPLLEIDATLPREVVAIVERTLAKSRDDRQQSMGELVRELVAYRQHVEFGDSPARGYSVATSSHRVPSDVPRERPLSAPAVSAGAAIPSAAVDRTASEAPTGLPMPTPIGMPAPSRMRRARVPRSAGRTAAIVVIIVMAGGYWISRRSSSAPPAAPQTTAPSAVPPQTAPVQPAAPQQTAPPPPASGERPRQDEDRPALDAAARDARDRMNDAKASARRSSAPKNNPAGYGRAVTAEREAERLFKAGLFAESTTKFYEAGGLYRSSESALEGAAAAAPPRAVPGPVAEPPVSIPAPPSPAPATPPAEKQTVTVPAPVPPPPQPAATPAAPPPPVTTPASSTPTTSTPPAATPAPTPAPVPAGPPPEEAIKEVLSHYQEALEARSLEALKRLWPSLAGAQQSAIQDEFRHARSIAVTLLQPRITVAGNTATVTFTRRYNVQTTDGQRHQADSPGTMTLRLNGGAWVIDQLRFGSGK